MHLKPHDLVAALKLAVGPSLTYPQLAVALSLSLSEAHGAVKRSQAAGLLLSDPEIKAYRAERRGTYSGE